MLRHLSTLVIVCCAALPLRVRGQGLTDVSLEAGLTVPLEAPQDEVCIRQFFCAAAYGGTAATADLNDDGFPDLYVGGPFAGGTLYLSQGNGTFEDATRSVGLVGAPPATTALFVDVDADGDSDLVLALATPGPVSGVGHYPILLNVGTPAVPHFTSDASHPGLAIRGSGNGPVQLLGIGLAAGDFDLDGYTDLFVGSWQGIDTGCGVPRAALYRNRGLLGPGMYYDATRDTDTWPELGLGFAPGEIAGVAFGAAFTDLDADGLPDLLVTADFGRGQYFRNLGDGRFADRTRAFGLGLEEFGMGSTLGDVDQDGRLDLFVTSINDPEQNDATGNRLYLQRTDGTFEEQSSAYGVRDSGWGWGTTFFDLDNDGDLDLASTGGNSDYPLVSPFRVWTNHGAPPFVESADALGVSETAPGRALLALDYDRDGDQDLLVVRFRGPPLLLRNDVAAPSNAWLTVVPRGTVSNRDGWGAKVWVRRADGRVWYREIGTVSHFTGVGPREAHVGLGAMPDADERLSVEVEFLGGRRVQLAEVARNQVLSVVEPELAQPRARLPVRVAPDCDGDRLPDVCGYDCDGNVRPDVCDIALDAARDADASGFLDICEDPTTTPDAGVDLALPADVGAVGDAGSFGDAGRPTPVRLRGGSCALEPLAPRRGPLSLVGAVALLALALARRLNSARTAARARTHR